MMRRNQRVRVHFQQQNWPVFISFRCFQASFFPTQDHLSMCHPHNKTKGQTQLTAWIIACPELQKCGLQLLSSHLHNRPRNTERWQKVSLPVLSVDDQTVYLRTSNPTGKSWKRFLSSKPQSKRIREQTRPLNPHVPVSLTPHWVCHENGIGQTSFYYFFCIFLSMMLGLVHIF